MSVLGKCVTCGLDQSLCVCDDIARGGQRIKVRIEKRKWGKEYTVLKGLDPKSVSLKDLTQKLKQKFACGGTYKGSKIELQGNHISRISSVLMSFGFSEGNIDLI